jgi:hypothetical protein
VEYLYILYKIYILDIIEIYLYLEGFFFFDLSKREEHIPTDGLRLNPYVVRIYV